MSQLTALNFSSLPRSSIGEVKNLLLLPLCSFCPQSLLLDLQPCLARTTKGMKQKKKCHKNDEGKSRDGVEKKSRLVSDIYPWYWPRTVFLLLFFSFFLAEKTFYLYFQPCENVWRGKNRKNVKERRKLFTSQRLHIITPPIPSFKLWNCKIQTRFFLNHFQVFLFISRFSR